MTNKGSKEAMSLDSHEVSTLDTKTRDWLEEQDTTEIVFEKSAPSPRPEKKQTMTPEWQFSIGIACIILGIMVSLLFKTYKREGSLPTLWTQREDLAKMVKYLEKERNKLQMDLNIARQTINKYEENSSKGKVEYSTIRNNLVQSRQEAGLTSVHGPGIIVRLNDSPIKPKDGDDPNYYIVHDVDLMALVNELWASGAEAVSINDQRMVMTSPIRCVGPTITVNTVRLTPPYIVKAIGPSSTLETGLRYTGGFLDSMSPNMDRGVEIRISKNDDIIIPAYKGSLVNRYAKPYVNK